MNRGHTGVVAYLAHELKINPNIQDHAGDTALHDAARFGHVDVVQILLEAGADPSIKNNQGKDPLTLAELANKEDVIKILRPATQSRRAKI